VGQLASFQKLRYDLHDEALKIEHAMARRLPFSENLSFAKQIKSLADDELLDIWEETQRLEHLMLTAWDAELELAPEYERLIVLELQYRMNIRGTESLGVTS
jgi:hypothetical protein